MSELAERFLKEYVPDHCKPRTRVEYRHAVERYILPALVIAIDSPEKTSELVRYARRRRPDLTIIARARDRIHAFQLYQENATHIVRETFDSSLRAGRYLLQRMGVPEDEAHLRTRNFYRYDRSSTRELALVWDPDLPIERNEVYIKRLHELSREMNLGRLEAFDDPTGPGSETISPDAETGDGEQPDAGDPETKPERPETESA